MLEPKISLVYRIDKALEAEKRKIKLKPLNILIFNDKKKFINLKINAN